MSGRRERWLVAFVALELLVLSFAYFGPQVSIGGIRYGRDHSSRSRAIAGPLVADPSPTDSVKPSLTSSPSPAPPPAPTEPSATTPLPSLTPTVPPSSTPATVLVRRSRSAGWVSAENARTGTDRWKIGGNAPLGWIEGYARSTSTGPGDSVTVFVDTPAPSYTLEAYRMGFYGGKQGRLLWTSPSMVATRQPPPTVDAATGLAEARWTPSLTLPVGDDWPPGSYLLKLVSSAGGASYVPLTVRDDGARADVLVMNAVTTWQSYNQWGACSLYACGGLRGRARAVKVSFDRPYARQYNDGSADFLDHELPLVALVEELGLDAAYATNLDVHETPGLLRRYKAAFSLGHDEYYSRSMRKSLLDARDNGVNLAFFGANAVYRHIRLEAASDGRPDRVMVNYRSSTDPAAVQDPTDGTSEWRVQKAPEAALVGIQYLCADVNADLIVAASNHWVWGGAGVRDGQPLRHLIGNEADGVNRGVSPPNIDLLGSSPVRCNGGTAYAHTSYYAAASGAGVFASGTIWWICALEAQYCSEPGNIKAVRSATTNVIRAFALGPAGAVHPSGPASRA